MLRRITLSLVTIIFEMLFYVSSQDDLPCINQGDMFELLNVKSFIDENRYIRLNISWERRKADFTNFEMWIDTNCSALYGERNISVDQKFIIEPNMERLKHPAEPPSHSCKYDFKLSTEATFGNQSCTISQEVSYEIPVCVDTVCLCEVASSPYEYQEIKSIGEDLYEVKFYKTDSSIDLNLEEVFHRILYTNVNSNKTVTTVHPADINFENDMNAFTIPLNEILSGNSYIIYIDLVLDNCEYHFMSKLEVPEEPISEFARHYASYFMFLLLLCVFISLYAFIKTKPQLIEKFRRYLPFVPALPDRQTSSQELGMIKITKEFINSQYTPLEFIVNAHKFDKYEFPRNKILLKNQIGGGAFGHVYKAEIYELDNRSGYTVVAAKRPIENAPSEEIADFLAEIETMKKIADRGGHRNIIKILACVTIELPHIMVMELVPCGSLKSYLSSLRKEWEQRKRMIRIQTNNQHFFPEHRKIVRKKCLRIVSVRRQNQKHNMIVEHYLRPIPSIPEKEEQESLKYSDLAFEDYTDRSNSSETNSYITPDTPRTPSTPGTPFGYPSIPKMLNKAPKRHSNKMMPSCSAPQSPITPDSITSSGLPSATYTLLTPLESEVVTPLIDLTEEDKIKPVLDSKELQSFALQIADGMAFLESIDLTHRDLAARNILISENKVLKISDFGMARVGIYVNTTQKRQPLRWMAPEAIENRRCDNKTDVWSFGVVLWEIGSLGAFPYKDLSNELVIAHILQGKRLERPETCTDQLYELMQRCWQPNPENRPRFEEISNTLDITNGKIYVDFSKISTKYSFPPTQEESK